MRFVRFQLSILVILFAPISVSAEVAIDWVTVGDPGNACDTQPPDGGWPGGCFGAVSYEYRISKYEVTNAQYAEFLNAVAKTDTNALWNTDIGSAQRKGGITRSGSSGSYTYSTIAGREDMPVNWVSFWAATRFANWLHNGQPAGVQDNTTTEDGAYTLTPTGIADNTVTRNAAAQVFVPSENEWYKAAYYDPSAMDYFIWPTGSDTLPACALPTATANRANCHLVVNDLTGVGGYTGSASPSGTFDQGGNVQEWSESMIVPTHRGYRGGGYSGVQGPLAAVTRQADTPSHEHSDLGIRVASPAPAAPSVPSLHPLAIAMLSSLLGFAGWRRLRA